MLSDAAYGRHVEDLLTRCTFPLPGTPVSCAVSGGADSLALLVLAAAADCEVTAIHVDHSLRVGSGEEASVVADAAGRFGAKFVAAKASVKPGPNLEARARMARYSVLPAEVSTGHTMDDQAETVLLNFLRGAGIDGLAGMRRGLRHPLLGIRRSETRSLCDSLGLFPVADASNDDPAYLRNRVRHELLPLCAALSERDVVPVIARQAGILADEADLLDQMARGIDPTFVAEIVAAPLPLARRAVRRWLRGDGPYPPGLAAIERVLGVASGQGVATEVAPGMRISRSRGRLSAKPVRGLVDVDDRGLPEDQ